MNLHQPLWLSRDLRQCTLGQRRQERQRVRGLQCGHGTSGLATRVCRGYQSWRPAVGAGRHQRKLDGSALADGFCPRLAVVDKLPSSITHLRCSNEGNQVLVAGLRNGLWMPPSIGFARGWQSSLACFRDVFAVDYPSNAATRSSDSAVDPVCCSLPVCALPTQAGYMPNSHLLYAPAML
ncbi:hypothetical protein GGR50DRAFT_208846 [Xylaria sp. CBS 124048]|nr:hypothetical protein GGR50DRAFT_208846 [Xylaria sp. CBS 124048]